jgi:TDG/mug DNA glycosylase family protein
MADPPTLAVYEARARDWQRRRPPLDLGRAAAFARRARRGAPAAGPLADLGCGAGGQLAALGRPTVGLDASAAMLALAGREAPDVPLVRADLEALPFRAGSLGAAWAARSYVHVAASALPAALADLHRALALGAPIELALFPGARELSPRDEDDFPGRRFSGWDPLLLGDVVHGAGFDEVVIEPHRHQLQVRAVRARTLPDQVGPGLRLLICGLNPSLYAADAGLGFARPGNRFWPAARASGLVTRPRDPRHARQVDRVGMTDLVKRATVGADELSPQEYRAGVARLDRLVRWLQPRATCFVGLAGWRAAVDRRAAVGVQPGAFGGRPAYLMPNTSGLNARASLDQLTEHLRAAAALADAAPPPAPPGPPPRPRIDPRPGRRRHPDSSA